MAPCPPRDGAGNRKQEAPGARMGWKGTAGEIGFLGRNSTTLTCLSGLAPGFFAAAGFAPRASRDMRTLRERGQGGSGLGELPGVRRVTGGGVPASKMAAAAAAVSGALGRAGWRLLQLRCLPGEGAAEPGSGEEQGGGTKPAWPGCGAEEAAVAAHEQGEVKGIGAEPPASRARRGRLAGFCSHS